jgi:hypothetical protein
MLIGLLSSIEDFRFHFIIFISTFFLTLRYLRAGCKVEQKSRGFGKDGLKWEFSAFPTACCATRRWESLGLQGLKVPNSAAYYGRTLAALFRLLRGTKCLNLFDVAEKARGKVGYRRVL